MLLVICRVGDHWSLALPKFFLLPQLETLAIALAMGVSLVVVACGSNDVWASLFSFLISTSADVVVFYLCMHAVATGLSVSQSFMLSTLVFQWLFEWLFLRLWCQDIQQR